MKFTPEELKKIQPLIRANNTRLQELGIDVSNPESYREWDALLCKVTDALVIGGAALEVPDGAPFGEKLKAVRKAAGLDQRQLAAMTGFSQVDISRWEAGREPKATTLKRLAEALGCSMDDLV